MLEHALSLENGAKASSPSSLDTTLITHTEIMDPLRARHVKKYRKNLDQKNYLLLHIQENSLITPNLVQALSRHHLGD